MYLAAWSKTMSVNSVLRECSFSTTGHPLRCDCRVRHTRTFSLPHESSKDGSTGEKTRRLMGNSLVCRATMAGAQPSPVSERATSHTMACVRLCSERPTVHTKVSAESMSMQLL